MLIKGAGRILGDIVYQRCFYLFLMLMLFIGAVSFVGSSPLGHISITCANALLVVATVASVGRSTISFGLAMVLAVPAIAFQWIALRTGDPQALLVSRWLGVVLYATAIGFLMNYVFQREVMTADKLFGAASMYLLIGVFWAFLYARWSIPIIRSPSPLAASLRGRRFSTSSISALRCSPAPASAISRRSAGRRAAFARSSRSSVRCSSPS